MKKSTCKVLLWSAFYWFVLEGIAAAVLFVSYSGIPNPTYEQQRYFMRNIIILVVLTVPGVITLLTSIFNWKGAENNPKKKKKSKKVVEEEEELEDTLHSLELKD